MPGATLGYEVWRCPSNQPAGAVKVAEAWGLEAQDAGTAEGVTNFYWVKARNGAGASACSAADSGYRAVAAAAPPLNGFLAMGAVFLVETGGEALYADMGHFGKKPIRLAWFTLVLPCTD